MKRYKTKVLSLIKRLGYFSFSTIILQASGFVRGFLIPLFLKPDTFGILNKLNLILYYGSYADLGVSNGMGRYLPQYLGANDTQKAQKVADSTLTVNILNSGILFLVTVMLVISMPYRFSKEMAAGVIFFSFALILVNIKKFFSLYLRSKNDFKNLGNLNVIDGISSLLITAVLLFYYKIYGIFVANLLSGITCVLFLFFLTGYRYRNTFDYYYLKKIFSIGLPMLILGLLFMLGNTLDRLVIIKFFNNQEFGYYAIGFTIRSSVSTLPQSIATFYAPKVFQNEKCTEETFKYYIEKHVRIFILINIVTVACLFPVIPYIIYKFLPHYSASIALTKIFLLSIIFYGINSFSSNFLIMQKKFVLLYFLYIVPIAISLFFYLAVIRMGLGIFSVSVIFLIYSMLSSAVIILISLLLICSDKARAIGLFFKVAFMTAYGLASIILIDFILESSGISCFSRPLLYCFFYAVLFSITFLILIKISFPDLSFDLTKNKGRDR